MSDVKFSRLNVPQEKYASEAQKAVDAALGAPEGTSLVPLATVDGVTEPVNWMEQMLSIREREDCIRHRAVIEAQNERHLSIWESIAQSLAVLAEAARKAK